MTPSASDRPWGTTAELPSMPRSGFQPPPHATAPPKPRRNWWRASQTQRVDPSIAGRAPQTVKKPREMLVSMSVVVDLPIERFDLAGWLPRLAAEDYVACTHIGHAHRWWNVYRRDDGKRVFRADDAMGPLRTTSFFVEDISRRLQLSLISTETRATWQGWPGRSVITTTWDMRVQPVDEARSRFTCTMGWRLHWLDRIGSRMLGLRAFADNRIEEATPHLADSAVRWSSRRVAEAASASIRRPEMRTEPESALARY